MSDRLKGKRIAVLATEGVEQVELTNLPQFCSKMIEELQ
jgi:hypothetical protein